jgi:hypothetical protein
MPTTKQLQRELPGIMRALEETLADIHGERIGATIFVFELSKDHGTNLAYISNAERPDMIAAVKAWLARAEAALPGDPSDPPGSVR